VVVSAVLRNLAPLIRWCLRLPLDFVGQGQTTLEVGDACQRHGGVLLERLAREIASVGRYDDVGEGREATHDRLKTDEAAM
jgi:hypothetical protein